MRLTVSTAIPDQPIADGAIARWLNREGLPVLRQLRAFANFLFSDRKTAITAGGGAYTRIWTSGEMPTDGTWLIIANVTGVSVSGAAQRAGYVLSSTFQSTSGTCAQVGAATTVASHESAAAIDARLAVDTTNRVVYLEARDDGTSPMRFVAVVSTNEAL